jgi:hypothetical protein
MPFQSQTGVVAFVVNVLFISAHPSTAAAHMHEDETVLADILAPQANTESEALQILRAASHAGKSLAESVDPEHDRFVDNLIAESLVGKKKTVIAKRR